MKHLFLLSILIVCAVVYLYTSKYTHTKSSIDGKYYKTKNNHLAQQSADAMAQININLLNLIEHIKKQETQPEYSGRLYAYNPHAIEENIMDMDTTYTINKGSYVVFCMSPRDTNTGDVYDINTLMYVAIHELAHIVSLSIGHTEEFKKNFSNLLKHAIDSGIYTYIDYSKKPQEYCGIMINNSVISQ